MKCGLCGRTIMRPGAFFIDCKRSARGDIIDVFLCAECGTPRTCHDCGRPLGDEWYYGWGVGQYLCPTCKKRHLAAFRRAGEVDAKRGREERPSRFFRRPALY